MTISAMWGSGMKDRKAKQLEESHSVYIMDKSMICPLGIADQLNPLC